MRSAPLSNTAIASNQRISAPATSTLFQRNVPTQLRPAPFHPCGFRRKQALPQVVGKWCNIQERELV